MLPAFRADRCLQQDKPTLTYIDPTLTRNQSATRNLRNP